MISSTSSGFAAASDSASGIRGEEHRRHHVDPSVGALGRQDGRRQQLERVLEIQRAQLVGRARVALGQALDGQAGPTLRCPGLRHRLTVPGYVGRQWTLRRAGHGGRRPRATCPRPIVRSLNALLGRANAASDHPPLPEPQLLAVTHPRRRRTASASCWPAQGTELAGLRPSLPARDGSTVAAPGGRPVGASRRPSRSGRCCRRAVPGGPRRRPVHLWAMQAGRGGRRARPPLRGFVPERDLLQMRVAPPAARRRRGGDPAAAPPGLRARPRRGGVGRHQQPGLRRPPRAGRVDRRPSSASAWPPTGSTSTASWSPTTPTGRASSGPAGPRSTATARPSSARST